MKSLWKSLLIVCALSGVLTLAAAVGCGPQQAFCPNTGGTTGVCPVEGDDVKAMPPSDGGNCPPGEYFYLDPNPPFTSGCIAG